MNRLKMFAVVYLVKTLVLGVAWLLVPDLPQRTMSHARQAWAWATGEEAR